MVGLHQKLSFYRVVHLHYLAVVTVHLHPVTNFKIDCLKIIPLENKHIS